MKKIINAPEQDTDDMLRGIYAAHPGMVTYAVAGAYFLEGLARCFA